jgi:hypothetical protein
LAIFYRLNYLGRHYQYTPASPAYQLPILSKDVVDLFITIEQGTGLLELRAMPPALTTEQNQCDCR